MASKCLAVAAAIVGYDAARVKKSTNEEVWQPKLIGGNISMKFPAFLSLFEDEGDKGKVAITQFGREKKLPIVGTARVSKLDAGVLGKMIGQGSLSDDIETEPFVSTFIQWPNLITKFGEYTVIPDGFLVPGRDKSGIFLADSRGSRGNVHCITREYYGFYHEVKWIDFDGDGHKDVLTARTLKSFDWKFTGQLIWLKNPGPDRMMKEEWKETFIVEGPDIVFVPKKHRDGWAVYCSEFFSKRITVHFLSAKGEHKGMRIIDDTPSLGGPFAVELVDIDGDGTPEILATNHENKKEESAVFAYTIPPAVSGTRDLEKGEFKRHTLAIDIFFTVDFEEKGMASPGFAHAFYPRIGETQGPKHLVVSGDGAHDVWYLRPKGGRFEYEPIRVDDWKGTTGQMLLHDFDGNGIMDVLVPDNDQWTLRAFTFEEVSGSRAGALDVKARDAREAARGRDSDA